MNAFYLCAIFVFFALLASGQSTSLPEASPSNLFFLVSFLFLVVFVLAGFFTYRTRQRAKELHIIASKDREVAMMREQLYVNVTHELRTPLTLIITPLEKLAAENPHPDITLALDNARELLQRFNDILKWNKLEGEGLSVNLKTGDAVHELGKTVARFLPLAKAKNIQLRFSTHEKDCLARLDFEKIETILSNLLINAIKFTEAGGEIVLTLACTAAADGSNRLQLEVSDNGKGISEEALATIFKRYYQSGNPTFGAGIGLDLSKKLTELMGGEITASRNLAGGTTFSVILPFEKVVEMDMAMNELANEDAEIQNNQNNGKPTLLVVEDNDPLRNFVVSSLQASYRVLQASSHDAALAVAREQLPDIVLSDIMLIEGPDGIALCKALKNDPLTCHIPVVMLTARTGLDAKTEALSAGADAFLTKPFNFTELELTLGSLLENRRILRERFKKNIQLNWSGPDVTMKDPFLENALERIHKELDNASFGVEQLAAAMHISRVQLFHRLKSVTDMAPGDLIRHIRLEKANHLLKSGQHNVSSVAYMTGFNNPNYFSKAFKKHFGISPSEVDNRLN